MERLTKNTISIASRNQRINWGPAECHFLQITWNGTMQCVASYSQLGMGPCNVLLLTINLEWDHAMCCFLQLTSNGTMQSVASYSQLGMGPCNVLLLTVNLEWDHAK